jgi:hypothetical protein
MQPRRGYQRAQPTISDRLVAVEQLAAMSLPVGSVEEMKRESVDPPRRLPDEPSQRRQ